MEIGHERLAKLVDRLLGGEIVLPDIQRDFVWKGSRIPHLLDSLYREWPVGSILLWQTELEVPHKEAAVLQGTPVGVKPAILLDGQQRISTLARVMAPEKVPEGQRPPDIRFHPARNEFRTANAVSVRDPAWISVSEILRPEAQFRDLLKPIDLSTDEGDAWYEILSHVAGRIRNYRVPVQTVSIDDYETVAEIFNRVNTGGRSLSKGDLIMGTMAARWPPAPAHGKHPADEGGRRRIEAFEEEVAAKNWPLNREVLLRIMSVLTNGSPNHTRLLGLREADEWKQGWESSVEAINHALAFLKNDAGIPARSLLPTEYVLLVPAVFLDAAAGVFASPEEREMLRRWVYLASAFGHYSGSVETTLGADVKAVREMPREDLLPYLIAMAQDPRTPETRLVDGDLLGKTRKSPLLKLLQIAAVGGDAKSWRSHRAITYDPDSRGMAVEIHHVFPKNWLRKNGQADHPELDTLANFAFLSKHDNIKISDGDPVEYLAEADPGELESQWIPIDPELWRAERFTDFCAARRQLLVGALNDLLGLTGPGEDHEPLDADEAPEPELGAWAEDQAPRADSAVPA